MPNALRKIFVGSAGVRSGWRLLVFLVLLTGIILLIHYCIYCVSQSAHQAFEDLRKGKFTPLGLLAAEFPNLIGVFAALWIMGRWEHRRLADYGLPGREAFGKWFWSGIAWGIILTTVLYAMLWVEGHYSFGRIVLSGSSAVKAGAMWAVAALIVGFVEELVFRGYAQKTLGESLGFWPAAVILSLVFGLVHMANTGYSWMGVGSAAMIGITYCLSLRLLGSLWWAVGFHSAFDFMELFVYSWGTGTPQAMRVLDSSLSGPQWLTGGTVGAEASVNGYVMLIISLLLVYLLFRPRKSAA